jgi:hypothetical protein
MKKNKGKKKGNQDEHLVARIYVIVFLKLISLELDSLLDG